MKHETHYSQVKAQLLKQISDQDCCEAYVCIAKAYFHSCDDQNAIKYFQKAHKKFPNNPIPCIQFGKFYDNIGKNIKAREQFLKSLQIDPTNIEGKMSLGSIYLKQDQDQQAEKYFNELLQSQQTFDGKVYVKLGIIQMKKKSLQKAVKFLQKAYVIDPFNYECYFYYSKVLQLQGKDQDALQRCESALQGENQNPIYRLHKIYLLHKLNYDDQVLQQLNAMEKIFKYYDGQPNTRYLLRRYNLTKDDNVWIQERFKLFKLTRNLINEKNMMNQQGKKLVRKSQFQLFPLLVSHTQISVNQAKDQSEEYKQAMKKIKQLQQQNKIMSLYVRPQLKMQFDRIKSQNRELQPYFIELSKAIPATISAYYQIDLGLVKMGDNIMATNISKITKCIRKGLQGLQKVPVLKTIVSILGAVADVYLELQLQAVIKQMSYAFSKYSGQTQLTYATIQMILSMYKSHKFRGKFKKYVDDDNESQWYIKLLQNLNQTYKKGKSLVVEKVGGVGGWKCSKYQGIAQQHCVEILLIVITAKNVGRLQQSKSILQGAAEIWFEEDAIKNQKKTEKSNQKNVNKKKNSIKKQNKQDNKVIKSQSIQTLDTNKNFRTSLELIVLQQLKERENAEKNENDNDNDDDDEDEQENPQSNEDKHQQKGEKGNPQINYNQPKKKCCWCCTLM